LYLTKLCIPRVYALIDQFSFAEASIYWKCVITWRKLFFQKMYNLNMTAAESRIR